MVQLDSTLMYNSKHMKFGPPHPPLPLDDFPQNQATSSLGQWGKARTKMKLIG